jgi:hypothetical protein
MLLAAIRISSRIGSDDPPPVLAGAGIGTLESELAWIA